MYYNKVLPTDRWICSLQRCPSQCYRRMERDDASYIMYLRWRGDPWEGWIISNASTCKEMTDSDDALWSDDLLLHSGYLESQLEDAKRQMESIFYERYGQ